jgi:tRNA (guanine-N7-)-methyltransferase
MGNGRHGIAARARIRRMTAEDGPSIAAVHRRAILAVPDEVTPAADRDSWAHGLRPERYAAIEEAGAETFLLAELGGALAGFVSYALRDDVGEISGLYVDPDWQRRGIGRRLAERAEAILRGHGVGSMRVRASLAGAPAYAALGYVECGRSVHRTRGGRDLPMVRMEKPLAGDWRNLYGRRHGKALRASQRAALAQLARLAPGPVTREENPERRTLDLSRLDGRPLWLEIGFGGGEHLVYQAALNPCVEIIGAEPFVNGVAMLLAKIEAAGVSNIRVHPGDARDLIEVLPEASVARAFLLYPDPWPKRRHHRRRFVTAEHLGPLARVLAPGAEFRIATDIPDYVRQARQQVPQHGFRDETADESIAWPDWVRTRYEAKALREGRRPHYLTWRRA